MRGPQTDAKCNIYTTLRWKCLPDYYEPFKFQEQDNLNPLQVSILCMSIERPFARRENRSQYHPPSTGGSWFLVESRDTCAATRYGRSR